MRKTFVIAIAALLLTACSGMAEKEKPQVASAETTTTTTQPNITSTYQVTIETQPTTTCSGSTKAESTTTTQTATQPSTTIEKQTATTTTTKAKIKRLQRKLCTLLLPQSRQRQHQKLFRPRLQPPRKRSSGQILCWPGGTSANAKTSLKPSRN